jgi:hypothetical protein
VQRTPGDANGSRECALDDRLRGKQSMPLRHCERSEAIHGAAQRKNGLLRRFAPRNDGKGWIASSLALLAMTEERGSSQ